MALLPFKEEDFYEKARSRVTFAWENKVVFDKYIQLLLSEFLKIQLTLKDLKQQRYIDTAHGKQLDLIGKIVGQDRVVIDADNFPLFGYEGAPEARSYGSVENKSVGGYYWDMNKPKAGNVTLTDEQYRLFIKSKIIKNTTACTPEQVISFIKFMYSVDEVTIYDGDLELYIFIGKNLTPFEKAVINYHEELNGYDSFFIPKPVGVKIHVGEFDTDNAFAFEGCEGGGYSDLDNPDVGGVYSTLII